MVIKQNIQAYYVCMASEHHRYRSWEHCYRYFQKSASGETKVDRDQAALQLGFYLASWGMYRGSSFLLQHAYTVHRGVIDRLNEPRFSVLRTQEFGAGDDLKYVPLIMAAIETIREAYAPFIPSSDTGQPTDTLVTKIILGTFGCLPACDRLFIDGFKSAGFSYSYLNAKFIQRVLQFCKDHLIELRAEQEKIERAGGMLYPLMKLVDMLFWQVGFERSLLTID